MADLTDHVAANLAAARARLRKGNRTESVDAERALIRDVARNLEAAAEGLLDATRLLEARIDELDDRMK